MAASLANFDIFLLWKWFFTAEIDQLSTDSNSIQNDTMQYRVEQSRVDFNLISRQCWAYKSDTGLLLTDAAAAMTRTHRKKEKR